MKFGLLVAGLLLSFSVFAGGYYTPRIDTYDPITGLYFKGIESPEKSGFLNSGNRSITNLYIYDPIKNTGKLLFSKKSNFQIVALSFETSVENGEVKFYSDFSASIKNNDKIAPREPKSTLLILTRDVEGEKDTFYLAQKNGNGLKEVKTISSLDEWHVDVKNSVVRIVKQVGLEIKMDQFKW
ncbi:hypothetical protein [Neptunomonas sp.]|uniref:hypothetical protein n=1 Tax=Neptunomonas sp. TaxID=1971898 RepID=UPI0025E073B6|nr:hypothetical protein [Neptunomonas sp.]